MSSISRCQFEVACRLSLKKSGVARPDAGCFHTFYNSCVHSARSIKHW